MPPSGGAGHSGPPLCHFSAPLPSILSRESSISFGSPSYSVVALLAATETRMQRKVASTLEGVSPDQIVAVSYSVSRLLGMASQHHALIILRRD